MTVRRLASSLGAVLLAGGLLMACGSDDTSSTADATVETYTTVPDAQVVSGLADTQQLMDQLVTAGTTATQASLDAVESSWAAYEGNIRINDASAYLAAEDALALFDKAALAGDAAGMKAAADDFRSVATTYTTAHPG